MSPRSTTRPLYFWNSGFNSEFLRWQMSINEAKWTFFLSLCASRITSFFALQVVQIPAGIASSIFHSLATAAFASCIFIAWGLEWTCAPNCSVPPSSILCLRYALTVFGLLAAFLARFKAHTGAPTFAPVRRFDRSLSHRRGPSASHRPLFGARDHGRLRPNSFSGLACPWSPRRPDCTLSRLSMFREVRLAGSVVHSDPGATFWWSPSQIELLPLRSSLRPWMCHHTREPTVFSKVSAAAQSPCPTDSNGEVVTSMKRICWSVADLHNAQAVRSIPVKRQVGTRTQLQIRKKWILEFL